MKYDEIQHDHFYYALPVLFLLKDIPSPKCASGLENNWLFQLPWDPSLLTVTKDILLGFTP